jgi:hypothetical protein
MKELKNQEYLGIDENGFEHTGFLKDSLDEIKKKVFWETNSAVKRNSNIDSKQIIGKSATHDFPEGVTVRTHRMKDGYTSAYFNADVKKKYYGSGSNKTWFNTIGHKLIVGFPHKSAYGSEYGFTFNGNLDHTTSFNKMGQILDYIQSELNAMYDNGN